MGFDLNKSSSYLEYLPAIFSEVSEEVEVPFIGRFLLAFEHILTGLKVDFLLSRGDLKDSTSLAVKLRDASDPLSLFLQEQFSPETQQLLSEYDDSSPPAESLQSILIQELNQLLQGPSLYDEDRFAHVSLSQETQQLIEQSPEGEDLIRLNRRLLEEAYPHEIAKIEPRQGLEKIIADIPKLFDPIETPETFLQWLAGWVALSLRADWTTGQQRQFLARIVPLYRRRGTKQNLTELLQIYTGLEPVITEGEETVFQIGVHSTIGVDTQIGGCTPHYFRVVVTIANPDPFILQRQHQIITALIEQEKPAHTDYDLELIHLTMQIGVRSTIGVDTLLGRLP